MTAATTRRNPRNNPYILDDLAAGYRHSAAGALWRWRTEATVTAATGSLTGWLASALTIAAALIITAAVLAALILVPATRRFITRRAWCLITRHRLQRVCWETRMHTRSGRIPLVTRIRPTDVGERAWLLCRAGICAEDFEAHAGEIRAACGAREARVTRHPRWSQVVTIDVIRHDTLLGATARPPAHPHPPPFAETDGGPSTRRPPAWPVNPATGTATSGPQS